MPTPVERVHESFVRDRRIDVLTERLLEVLPPVRTVLDVGCGDGRLAASIARARAGVEVTGIDVLERPDVAIPVRVFDGREIPYDDHAFDAVTLVDVVHHADDPERLLREAARVSARHVVIKDHLLEGVFAGTTLAFMDSVGNRRHGVALPHVYWKKSKWQQEFEELPFVVAAWNERVGLYPKPAGLVFDRRLHFIARLDRAPVASSRGVSP